MKINAKISYKVKPTHPDLGDMPEHIWKDKLFTYDDEYTFDENWDEEDAKSYIRRDLALVAGGGYNAKHIYDVGYEMEVV